MELKKKFILKVCENALLAMMLQRVYSYDE